MTYISIFLINLNQKRTYQEFFERVNLRLHNATAHSIRKTHEKKFIKIHAVFAPSKILFSTAAPEFFPTLFPQVFFKKRNTFHRSARRFPFTRINTYMAVRKHTHTHIHTLGRLIMGKFREPATFIGL